MCDTAIGVPTQIDGDALANYCDAWSCWKRAKEFLPKNGDVYTFKKDSGNPKCVAQWPQVAIVRSMVLVLNKFQQEFGLTPSSRSRISLSPELNMTATPSVRAHDDRRRNYDEMIKAPWAS